jgi:uncharacterized membrane protein YphA (DoxX/SURF4 family)
VRLFHGFPAGRAGAGLLLLRAACGFPLLIQGVMELERNVDSTIGGLVSGCCAIAVGILLLVGLLTPISAGLAGLAAMGVWLAVVPQSAVDLFSSKPSVAFLGVIAVALVLLGPGAFSIDARIFGLREIIIPPSRSGI